MNSCDKDKNDIFIKFQEEIKLSNSMQVSNWTFEKILKMKQWILSDEIYLR